MSENKSTTAGVCPKIRLSSVSQSQARHHPVQIALTYRRLLIHSASGREWCKETAEKHYPEVESCREKSGTPQVPVVTRERLITVGCRGSVWTRGDLLVQPPILEANELVKYYRSREEPALDKLNLRVERGRIFTLLGRNGAGKTTFLRIASTQLLPTSGSLRVLGLDVVKEANAIRQKIAITPQEAKPLWTLNAIDHLILALMMRGVSHSAAAKKAREVIEALELTEFQKISSENLSGGLRQRILIAMTVASDVELMFLDEPTIGLDPIGRRRVWDELIRLKKEERRTIILTTHYMDEAEALSDDLALIERGKVLAKGTPAEVRSKHLVSKVRVDASAGFSADELAPYGRVTKAGNLLRLFVSERVAEEISRQALRRNASISVSPVTLDDVFVEIVGSRMEELDRDVERGADE